MICWDLDREGFVCHYLVSGPLLSEISGEAPEARDQLDREIRLRSTIADHELAAFSEELDTKQPGALGLPWRFVGGRDCAFVNLSDFYAQMHRVRFDVATSLVAPEAMEVAAVLWSYAAADAWLNGVYVGGVGSAVYKPIGRAELTLKLRKGVNTLCFRCAALGVRDTRSVMGLQLPGMQGRLRVTLPDGECARAMSPVLEFLEGIACREGALRFPCAAPKGAAVAPLGGFEPDYAIARRPIEWTPIEGETSHPLSEGQAWATVRVETPYGEQRRSFERTEAIRPRLVRPAPSYLGNLELILRRIASVEGLNRNGEFGFSISNILARRYLGTDGPDDERLFMDTLSLIERRVDCSDFLMSGLIRYIHSYSVADGLEPEVRRVILGWRYWMDMDGSDGMCFWSENHALMFYACAMLAGRLYPAEWFDTARMRGSQLSAWGRARVEAWLDDVERHGFEEFLSGVYMCITFVALLNVIDYGDEEISARAAKATDGLLEMLALHTWKGGFIAPMGRVYRGALYPFAQGVMALMNLIDPEQPYDYGEGWLGFYATSRYRLPDGLRQRIRQPVSTSYVTGNARVMLEKGEDWCLTSVACPREPFERWPNLTLDASADVNSHAYVKSLNERFHGTTDFQPGVYGYQQHLWYAALDGETVVFANHPGACSESGDMRPGYWHGNGVFPALKQCGNTLGMIYRIPVAHPLHYIHFYVPQCRFDEALSEGEWLFLRKGDGYIGLWASRPMEPWTGVNAGCEWRVYGDEIAALCVCGGREHGDIGRFMEACRRLSPAYDAGTGALRAQGYALTYVPGTDLTQYL